MKRTFFTGIAATALIIIMSSFAVVSYRVNKMQEELWKQLGTTESVGKSSISQSFLQGHLSTFSLKNAMNIALGNRAAVTTDLLKYVKQHVTAAAFQKEYEKFRESIKPGPPTAMKTKEKIREEFVKSTEEAIHNMEKVLAVTTDANTKKIFNEQIALQKKQLEDYKSPDSKMVDLAWQGGQNNFNSANIEYQKSVKQWETDYPQSHLQIIKARLLKFLDDTKDVDYNASLTEKNNKKYFTNPAYEAKNPQWKMAFRAGKEVTETARTFAQQWLKEL